MKYEKHDKVIAIKKTSGTRDFDNCASYYRCLELNQEFLYVNAVDEEATKRLGETCYWCDAVKGMGDSYRESDLLPYK